MKIYPYQAAARALLSGGQIDVTDFPVMKRSGRPATKAEVDAALEELKAMSDENPFLVIRKSTTSDPK